LGQEPDHRRPPEGSGFQESMSPGHRATA